MASMADGLEEISRSLQQGENVTVALRDLNILLEANDTPLFIQTVLASVPPTLVFGYLQSGPPVQVGLACNVLEKVLSRMPATELVKISTYVELGLQFTDSTIKRACLVALDANCNEIIPTIMAPTMFHLITQIMADESLECAKLASKILLKFLSHPAQLPTPVKDALVIDLTGIMLVSSTIRYRVYELGVRTIVNGNSESFELISSSGLLTGLLKELEHDDILAQLNCVELLLDLLESPDGVLFLEGQGVMEKLHTLLIKAQQDPFGAAILPGLIKFFGHVAMSSTDVLSLVLGYPHFLPIVLQALPTPHDTTLWGIAVDTFALLASKMNTRAVLLEQSVNTERCIKVLGSFIINGPTEVRIRSLEAVSQVLSCPEQVDSEESVSRKWFSLLGPKLFSTLMSLVKQPFPVIRHSALKVFLIMAGHEWGQKIMNSNGGFIEFLLDRSTESEKKGRELKCEIVCVLAASSCAESVWGNVDLLKLKKYEREGAFYAQSRSEVVVATEGSA